MTTITIGGAGLILSNTELNTDVNSIVEKIVTIKNQYSS
jgi:hypothetical protein